MSSSLFSVSSYSSLFKCCLVKILHGGIMVLLVPEFKPETHCACWRELKIECASLLLPVLENSNLVSQVKFIVWYACFSVLRTVGSLSRKKRSCLWYSNGWL
jgi:hypothetical protein